MSAINSLGGSSSPATASGFGSLSSAEFLNIMLTELQSQDPLEPQDSQALLDQFSSLYQIESNIELGDNLNRLVRQSEFASASTLIGNLVSGISLDNRRVADLVLSVSNTEDGPVLNLLDGSRMLFSNVDEIIGPLDLSGGTTDGTTGGTGDGTTDGSGTGNGTGDANGSETTGPSSSTGSGTGTTEDMGKSDGTLASNAASSLSASIDKLVAAARGVAA